MNPTTDKTRETRLRRMADRQGLRLVRSRRRDPRAFDYGRYWVVAAERGHQVDECEGCNERKEIPMVELDPGTGQRFPGICTECAETRYHMQVGQRIRLRNPGRDGVTDVQFLSPAENAIRIRYPADGSPALISWSDFDNSGFANLDEVEQYLKG